MIGARHFGERRAARGFSLVEMVVVIVIVGIVFAIGATLLGRLFTAFFAERDIAAGEWQGLIALERVSRELREIRSPAELTISPSNRILFTNLDGVQVEYLLSGTSLTRSSSDTAALALADNIGGLAFFYLQRDGQTTAASAATVSYITMRLQVTAENYSETLRITVDTRYD